MKKMRFLLFFNKENMNLKARFRMGKVQNLGVDFWGEPREARFH